LFHYSTAKPPDDNAHAMAGYGYGLPLSRIYARFLKGDIWLESKEGEGTVVYVKCKSKWDPDELI
jgi:signal transduction histidine kinase